MMCLEATWFVAAFHSTPMHDPGLEEFQRQATAERRYTVYILHRGIHPNYVEAVHFCKAPLWDRRLDLDSQNLTPRFSTAIRAPAPPAAVYNRNATKEGKCIVQFHVFSSGIKVK